MKITTTEKLDIPAIIANTKSYYIRTEKTLYRANWMDNYLREEDLDDMYVQLVYIGESACDRYRQPKTTYSLYDSLNNCPEPKRVLWIGDAGMGKTTASKKLAIDWSQDSPDFLKCLPGINLVLFLRCRELEAKLLQSISELLLTEPVDAEDEKQLHKYLKTNASEVLFVIDGIDELQQVNKELERLLAGKIFGESSIFVTSRRENLKGYQKYFRSVFEIRGFTKTGVEKFVKTYFGGDKCQPPASHALLRRIEQSLVLRELSRNPLCLLILCVVWEDKEGDLPKRRYELYSCFLDCILERFVRKEGKHEDIKIRSQLVKLLGKLAYNSLRNQRASFSHSDLLLVNSAPHTKEIVKRSGLLKIDRSRNQNSMWYEFFHKSFQEFFVCLYVIQQFEQAANNEKKLVYEEIQWLLQMQPDSERDCGWVFPMVVPFLCGGLDRPSVNFVFGAIFEKIGKLETKKWSLWGGVTCPLLEELDTECLQGLATCLTDVSPNVMKLFLLNHNTHTITQGCLRGWLLMKQNCRLMLPSGITGEELTALQQILVNESFKIQMLDIPCEMDIETFQVVAKRFWTSNIQVLILSSQGTTTQVRQKSSGIIMTFLGIIMKFKGDTMTLN